MNLSSVFGAGWDGRERPYHSHYLVESGHKDKGPVLIVFSAVEKGVWIWEHKTMEEVPKWVWEVSGGFPGVGTDAQNKTGSLSRTESGRGSSYTTSDEVKRERRVQDASYCSEPRVLPLTQRNKTQGSWQEGKSRVTFHVQPWYIWAKQGKMLSRPMDLGVWSLWGRSGWNIENIILWRLFEALSPEQATCFQS